jgi:hypothetical protein
MRGAARLGLERKDSHRPGDVLKRLLAEIDERLFDLVTHVAPSIVRQINRSWLANPFESGCDVHPIAHEVAVALLHDVAHVNSDPKFDPLFRRQTSVGLDKTVLNFDGAANGVDRAAKLDDDPVASPFDDAAVASGNCWVDEVAAQRPEPGESSLLVRPGEPTVADNIGDQDRSDLPDFGHGAPSRVMHDTTETGEKPPPIYGNRSS